MKYLAVYGCEFCIAWNEAMSCYSNEFENYFLSMLIFLVDNNFYIMVIAKYYT